MRLQEAEARALAPVSLEGMAAELMQKHRQNDSQASLSLSVLEIKGLRPRKGGNPLTKSYHHARGTHAFTIDFHHILTGTEHICWMRMWEYCWQKCALMQGTTYTST